MELTALLQTPSWSGRGLLPLIKNPPLLLAIGLDFLPFGAHSAISPTVFISPPMLRGLDKTLVGSELRQAVY